MLILDLVATFVFAASGALTAVRARLDIVGVVVLATLTGLGGGWIRDVLISAGPPASLADSRYLLVTVAAGIVGFFFHPSIGRAERFINVFDAFGLGLFVAAGATKAVDAGLPPATAVLLGVVTGVGGGVLRDTLVGRVPLIMQKGELYAIPATSGAVVIVLGLHLGQPEGVVLSAGAAVTILWRLLAMRLGWTAPEPRQA